LQQAAISDRAGTTGRRKPASHAHLQRTPGKRKQLSGQSKLRTVKDCYLKRCVNGTCREQERIPVNFGCKCDGKHMGLPK
jgi:hypothetical protein